MPAIINALLWFSNFALRFWDKFLVVVSGFFTWLFPALRSYFSRGLSNARFFSSFASLPFVKGAIVFFFISVIGVFVSTYLALIDIYIKIRNQFEGLMNLGSSPNVLGLFIDIANSIGIMEVLRDTYALWSPVLMSLISFVLSVLYYKAVMRFITFARQLHLFGGQ